MKKHKIQLLIVGLVVVAVLAVIFLQGDELRKFLDAAAKASPFLLILAVILQMCKYFSQALGYEQCFKATGSKISLGTGIGLVFGTFFVDTIAPSFDISGTSIVMEQAKKHGIDPGKGAGAEFLMQLCIDIGFVVVMAIAYIVLAFTVGLKLGWVLLGGIALLLVGGITLVMYIGATRSDLLKKIAAPFSRIADNILARFKKGPVDSMIDSTINSFSSSARQIASKRSVAVRAALCSVLASTFECSCFIAVGFAFGVHSIEALVCGYVLATLFAMVSITPQGVGVVEAAVMVGFSMFHIGGGTGLAIIMVYRGIVFWLPFIIGAITVQRMGAKA